MEKMPKLSEVDYIDALDFGYTLLRELYEKTTKKEWKLFHEDMENTVVTKESDDDRKIMEAMEIYENFSDDEEDVDEDEEYLSVSNREVMYDEAVETLRFYRKPGNYGELNEKSLKALLFFEEMERTEESYYAVSVDIRDEIWKELEMRDEEAENA